MDYNSFCNKMLILPIILLLLLFLTPLWVYIGCKMDCEKLKHTERNVNIMLKDVIKEEREKQDLSLSELARRSGNAVFILHAIETGENNSPSYRTIADICASLNLSLDELERRINEN